MFSILFAGVLVTLASGPSGLARAVWMAERRYFESM